MNYLPNQFALSVRKMLAQATLTVLFLVAVACSDHAANPDENCLCASLSTDKNNYGAGDIVVITLVNTEDFPMGADLCQSQLETGKNGSWQSVVPQQPPECPLDLQAPLQRSEQMRFPYRLASSLLPGEYRFRVKIHNLSNNSAFVRVTNRFQITD